MDKIEKGICCLEEMRNNELWRNLNFFRQWTYKLNEKTGELVLQRKLLRTKLHGMVQKRKQARTSFWNDDNLSLDILRCDDFVWSAVSSAVSGRRSTQLTDDDSNDDDGDDNKSDYSPEEEKRQVCKRFRAERINIEFHLLRHWCWLEWGLSLISSRSRIGARVLEHRLRRPILQAPRRYRE